MMLKLFLVGRLGRDPKLTHTRTGTILSFSMATDRPKLDARGKWESRPTWYEIAYQGQDADQLAAQLKKGQEVMVKAHDVKAVPWVDQRGDVRAALHVKAILIDPLTDQTTNRGYKSPEEVWSW